MARRKRFTEKELKQWMTAMAINTENPKERYIVFVTKKTKSETRIIKMNALINSICEQRRKFHGPKWGLFSLTRKEKTAVLEIFDTIVDVLKKVKKVEKSITNMEL